jgi:glutaredoxin
MLHRAVFALALAAGALCGVGNATAQSALADIHAPRVVMYATATCNYCAKARAYFTQHGITWEERDIEASTKAHDEWKAQGGFGTPLILIDGERVAGFDEARIESTLAKHKR